MLKRAGLIFGLIFAFLAWKAIPPEAIGKVFPAFAPKDDYDPYLTMTAPFSEHTEAALEKSKAAKDISLEEMIENVPDPAKVIPVNLPHDSEKAVSDWVIAAVSDALNYDQFSEAVFQQKAAYFTPAGAQAYRTFLERNKVIESVSLTSYQLSAIVEDTPFLRNKGAVGGQYKWLYRVPVLLSYIPRGATEYEKVTPVNLETDLKIQLTRTPETIESPSAVLIEIWDGDLRQKKD